MLIQLKTETLENSIGVLMDKTNGAVLEAVTPLANLLRNSGDNNKQAADLLELCKKFQNQFNEFTGDNNSGVIAFVEQIKGLVDCSEFLDKRKSIGEVGDRSTGFEVNKLNTQSLIQ